MLTDPYVVAALILGWCVAFATIVAFFIGRDKIIDDLRRQQRKDRS